MPRFPAWMLDLLGLTAAAYLAALTVQAVLAAALLASIPTPGLPAPTRPARRASLDDVTLGRRLGWSLGAERAARPRPAPPLRARLRGTVVGARPGWSWALLEDDQGAHLCVPGDRLGDAVVERVEPSAVRLRTPDGLEVLPLDGSQDPLPLAPAAALPARDLTPLLTGATALPALEDGLVTGLRLIDVRPGSVYARAGFRPGDVVVRVGGYDARSAGTLLAHAGELLARRQLDVVVRRGALETTLDLDLGP